MAMNKTLTKVALRYHAVFLDINREDINKNSEATIPVMAFVARLKENGFSVSEELLHALNAVSADTLAEITECINDVMGVNLNWASLVKFSSVSIRARSRRVAWSTTPSRARTKESVVSFV